MKHKKEWYDDESFWRDMYPFMFPEKAFSEARDRVKKILALTKPKGKALLDLCCGPGRYCVPFAKAGFRVTAVDKTTYLLNKARAKARAARAKIEWIQMDMRDFVRRDSFDLALSMFTSFGYFDNKDEDIAVLKNIFYSLRPGGKLIVDVGGKEWIARIFKPVSIDFLPNGTKLVQLHEVFDDWTRIRNEWILIPPAGGRTKSFTFHHTLYSGQELRNLLELAGFRSVKLYGNFDGDAYGTDNRRLIAVGQKPEMKKVHKVRQTVKGG